MDLWENLTELVFHKIRSSIELTVDLNEEVLPSVLRLCRQAARGGGGGAPAQVVRKGATFQSIDTHTRARGCTYHDTHSFVCSHWWPCWFIPSWPAYRCGAHVLRGSSSNNNSDSDVNNSLPVWFLTNAPFVHAGWHSAVQLATQLTGTGLRSGLR